MERDFSITQAARVLGCTPQRLYQKEREGSLSIIRNELGKKRISYDTLLLMIMRKMERAEQARGRLHRVAAGEILE